MKHSSILLRYVCGLLLLAIAPALMNLGLEQLLDAGDADDLSMSAFGAFTAAIILLLIGLAAIVAVSLAFPFDKKQAQKRQLPAPNLSRNVWMIVKIFSIPFSVAVLFGISQWLLALTRDVPPEMLAACGAFAAAAGYLLARPLVAKIFEVVLQALHLIWQRPNVVFSRTTIETELSLNHSNDGTDQPERQPV